MPIERLATDGVPIIDHTAEPFSIGTEMSVDLTILIENIYVSPYSPAEYCEAIASLLEKHNIHVPIIKSNLYDDSRFR